MGCTSAVVRQAAPTSTGTQSYTSTSFGTPVAALFIIAAATSDDTASNGASMGFGATDGTNHWAWCSSSEHGSGSSDTFRWRAATDECILIQNASDGNIDGEAAFSQWVTDGIEVNWGDAPASAWMVTCVLFGGADMSAHAGTFEGSATQDATADYTSIAWEPDALLVFGNSTNFTDAEQSVGDWELGFVVNGATGISQSSMNLALRDASATMSSNARTSGAYCTKFAVKDTSYEASEVTAFIDNGASSGFTVTTRDRAVAPNFCFLALNYGGTCGQWTGIIDSATSTGTEAYTDPGFQPTLVLMATGNTVTVDSREDGDNAGAIGYSCITSAASGSASVADDEGAADSDTQTITSAKAVNQTLDDGTAAHVATLDSMDALGFTLDFTTANGTARKWAAFAFGDQIAEPSGTVVRCTRVAAPTSTGTQDITLAALGGRPTAALFMLSWATTNETVQAGAMFAVGATDGTNQWTFANASRDGVDPSQCDKWTGMTDKCICVLDPAAGTTMDGEAEFVRWLDDGVRIDWTNAPSAAVLMTVVFFAGDDVSAQVGDFATSASIDGTASESGFGFEPDQIFFGSHSGTSWGDATATHSQLYFGFADNQSPITQGSMNCLSQDNQGTQKCESISLTGRVMKTMWDGITYASVEITSFDAGGFTATTRESANSQYMGYLAVKYGASMERWTDYVQSPTSAIEVSNEEPQFKPQFVMLLASAVKLPNHVETDAEALSFAITVFDDTRMYTTGIADEDAQVGDSDTQSRSSDSLYVDLPTGAAMHIATLTSFDTLGYTLDYTTADGTAREWIGLAIGDGTSAGFVPYPNPRYAMTGGMQPLFGGAS